MRGSQPHEHAPDSFLMGPGIDPSVARPTQHEPSPSDLLDKARQSARCEDDEEQQSINLTRRIVVAFVLIMLVGGIFFVVMPYYHMTLPPMMLVLVFAVIMLAAIMTGPRPPKKPKCNTDDGRAIGCCQGPRPLRSFRDKD